MLGYHWNKRLPSTNGKRQDHHPLLLGREVELENQGDRHGEDDEIGNDVEDTSHEDQGTVVYA